VSRAGARKRRRLVAGNWKMHLDHVGAIRLVGEVGLLLGGAPEVEVSVHPPFTALRSAATTIEDRHLPLVLGAQHCHPVDEGPYTGEVSAAMLERLGVRYVIVGHSERRRHFGETDADVRERLEAVLRHGMEPIVCVGETEAERDAGQTAERLAGQLEAALGGLEPSALERVVVAYEPVWAIGTGRAATPRDASSACAHLRAVAAKLAGPEAAERLRVLYGGSVTPENAKALLGEPDIDGALVGGASLDARAFVAIVRAAS
jgi:triosephosphate isomerase